MFFYANDVAANAVLSLAFGRPLHIGSQGKDMAPPIAARDISVTRHRKTKPAHRVIYTKGRGGGTAPNIAVGINNYCKLAQMKQNMNTASAHEYLILYRSDAYSAEQVLLNKQQIWCGGAYLDFYPKLFQLCAGLPCTQDFTIEGVHRGKQMIRAKYDSRTCAKHP